MPIRNEQELEKAMQEYQRLGQGDLPGADAARRDNLHADIEAYQAAHGDDLRKGRPKHSSDVEQDSPKSPSETGS